MPKRHVDVSEIRYASYIHHVVGGCRTALFNDDMMVAENKYTKEYRKAIESGRRWDAYTTWRADTGRRGYYMLTEKERMEVDLLVDMAKESV